MVIRANKVPFNLSFYERDNATLITRQTATNAMGWNGAAKTMAFDRDAVGKMEHFYGCGMHWKHFDLRGLNLKIYQIDPNLNKGSLDGSAITVVPYYWSTAGYGMLLHNSFISHFDFGETNRPRLPGMCQVANWTSTSLKDLPLRRSFNITAT